MWRLTLFLISNFVIGGLSQADPAVKAVGRLDRNICAQALVEMAADAIERRHPGRADQAVIGYSGDWQLILAGAQSEPRHSKASFGIFGKLLKRKDLPPIIGEALAAYKKLNGTDQLVVCAIPLRCADGETLGNPRAWMQPLGELPFRMRVEDEIHDGSIREATPKERERTQRIIDDGGIKFALYTAGLVETLSNQSGNDLIVHTSNMIHELRHVADFQLLSRWTKVNAERIQRGLQPDALFTKYGQIDADGTPSLDAGFTIVFLESRAWYAGIRSLPEIVPFDTYENLKLKNEPVAFQTIRKTGPGAVRVLEGENIAVTEVFSKGEEWGNSMKATLGE